MPDAPQWILGLVQIAVCVVPATLLAAVLRAARCPGGAAGAALAGGIIAGLLLGPGVLGRVASSWHGPMFVGGIAQAEALRDELDRQRIERQALESSGVTGVALDEHDRESLAPRRGELQAALDRARADHRAAFQLVQSVVAAAMLMLVLPRACARSGRLWRRTGETAIDSRWRGAGRGALALVISTSIPLALAWWLLRDLKLALGVAAALAVPAVVALPCGMFIATSAAAALGGCMAMVGLWTVPATVVGVAALVGLALCVGSERPAHVARVRGVDLVHSVLLAGLACLTVVTIDPHAVVSTGVFVWLTALALLWSSDGRWLGWRLAGHTWTRAAAPVSAGSSMVQLLIAAACAWAGVAQGAVAALVLGALTIELTTGIRSALARQMDEPPTGLPE